MNWPTYFFGSGEHLNSLQMGCRAFACFFITLILLRLAGIRTFGKKTAFDNVIIIMLGSVLSRVVVGASPFWPTCVACLVFVVIHRILGQLSYRFDILGHLIKGEKILLFDEKGLHRKNMRRAGISRKDLEEELRQQLHSPDWSQVKEISLERNGDLSILRKSFTGDQPPVI